MSAGAWIWFLAGAVLAAGWWLSLRFHPFGRCRACKGTGTNPGSKGGRFGLCRTCGGTRRRIRLGAGKTAARHLKRGK
jgi:DnaJ-class molecular chaperone